VLRILRVVKFFASGLGSLWASPLFAPALIKLPFLAIIAGRAIFLPRTVTPASIEPAPTGRPRELPAGGLAEFAGFCGRRDFAQGVYRHPLAKAPQIWRLIKLFGIRNFF
jgi:hypothetical protein